MKKAALFFATVFCISTLPPLAASAAAARKLSHEEAPWRMLEQAQVAYDGGNYGLALNLANKAKENRALQINWDLNVLETALSPRQVKKAGDRFEDVLAVLAERDSNEAIALIKQYLLFHGEAFYSNSVAELVSWLEKSAVYPEADFLTGKIYQLEGEFQLASSFYEKARTEADFLDVPDVKYDILYAMADLAKQLDKREEFEQSLLLVLSADENYQSRVLARSFEKIVDADSGENVDRFFSLFRCSARHSVPALYELSLLYKERGSNAELFKCAALGMLEAFTHMLEALQERDAAYRYEDLAGFFAKTGEYADFITWAQDVHLWELFFLFVDSSAARGSLVFAEQFYTVMSESLPDAYWRAQAANRLSKLRGHTASAVATVSD